MSDNDLTKAVDYLAKEKHDVELLSVAPSLSYDDAYRAQFASKLKQAPANGPIIGYQASFTSEGAKKLGPPDMPKPYFGTLQLRNWRNGAAPIPVSVTTAVECEVAFRLGAPLKGPGLSVADVRKAVASVHAAFEIVPLNVVPGGVSGQYMVAGHNFGSYIVVSEEAGSPEWDIVDEPVELYGDGKLLQKAVAGDSGGDPYAVLAEMANTLGRFGQTLESGMVVMTGSATVPHRAEKGINALEGRFGRLGVVKASLLWS